MPISFTRAIYSDAELEYIYWPEMLVAGNSWLEPDLTDLVAGDVIELWSADGRDYRGSHPATDEDVRQFRKLVATRTAERVYASPELLLADLTDHELECLLIARKLNS